MLIFKGKLAVVTGAGSGIGREIAINLSKRGCNLALCDIFDDNLAVTKKACISQSNHQNKIHITNVNVCNEKEIIAFRDFVKKTSSQDAVDYLFNVAGVGGGGSFINSSRSEWEKTFNTCWLGVYLMCRHFLPLLISSKRAHIVNVSSINGFWASLGPEVSHTAYSAAKFAVKGFTEALITDLRLNAPHVSCSVVMPGHIATNIAENTFRIHGKLNKNISTEHLTRHEMNRYNEQIAARLAMDPKLIDDNQILNFIKASIQVFKDTAPCSAKQAADIIVKGVVKNQWRILVGEDAILLDQQVRKFPVKAYDRDFIGLFNPKK